MRPRFIKAGAISVSRCPKQIRGWGEPVVLPTLHTSGVVGRTPNARVHSPFVPQCDQGENQSLCLGDSPPLRHPIRRESLRGCGHKSSLVGRTRQRPARIYARPGGHALSSVYSKATQDNFRSARGCLRATRVQASAESSPRSHPLTEIPLLLRLRRTLSLRNISTVRSKEAVG